MARVSGPPERHGPDDSFAAAQQRQRLYRLAAAIQRLQIAQVATFLWMVVGPFVGWAILKLGVLNNSVVLIAVLTVYVAACAATAVNAAQVSLLSGWRGVTAAVTFVLCLIPIVVHIVASIVQQFAIVVLAGRGLRVGFLGPSQAEREKLIENMCMWCRYDLTGIEAEICPECGRVARADADFGV